MTKVIHELDKYMKQNPPPMVDGKKLNISWSGLMTINNVWQNLMVSGMLNSLIGSFIIVFIMMIILFRSVTWSMLAMLPLSITITFIYGAIGFAGKYYDMPIAVLSSLTLGLSIDFAIHFIEHARVINQKHNNLKRTFADMFDGTAQAIWKNVLVISIGFLPLFFAGLVPYITVGSFFFAIMFVSGVTTLVLLPALLKIFYKYLPDFKQSTLEDIQTKGESYENINAHA